MTESLALRFRRPQAGADTYHIIRTYQATPQSHAGDPLFTDVDSLERSFQASEMLWLVAEDDAGFVGFVSVH